MRLTKIKLTWIKMFRRPRVRRRSFICGAI